MNSYFSLFHLLLRPPTIMSCGLFLLARCRNVLAELGRLGATNSGLALRMFPPLRGDRLRRCCLCVPAVIGLFKAAVMGFCTAVAAAAAIMNLGS